MTKKKQFDEDLQIYVFTTRFIVDDNSLITFVSHDEDGDWQFMGADEFTEEDARIISLEEMISFDSSILEIADLPLGYKAERDGKLSEWKIDKIE